MPRFWVPEGSLAGFLGYHELGLEVVRGADFSWKLMCGAGPGDLGGSRGSASAENPGKTVPKVSSQTAFRYSAPEVLWQQTISSSVSRLWLKAVATARGSPMLDVRKRAVMTGRQEHDPNPFSQSCLQTQRCPGNCFLVPAPP